MIAAVHSVVGVEGLLGLLIVIGCLIAAAVAAFRAAWIPALILLAVAIVAAALLL